MFPRSKKQDKKYSFVAELNKDELAILNSLLGGKVEALHFKILTIAPEDLIPLRSSKYLAIEVHEKNDNINYVILESLTREYNPLVGTVKSIWVKILKVKRTPLAQRMYEIKNRLDSSYTSQYRIDKPPIKNISVFGYIDEIDQNELVGENHLAHLLYAMEYVDLPDV